MPNPTPSPTLNHPLYHCSCSPSLPSSSSSSSLLPPAALPLHPLSALYFCDECDAIRCDGCVSAEVASYFCPGCLFEVANASVKGDKARCARNCFTCPSCAHKLSLESTDLPNPSSSSSPSPDHPNSLSERTMGTGPYVLACPSCRWSSEGLGKEWVFEKGVNIAQQVLDRSRSSPSSTELESLTSYYDNHLTSHRKFAEANPKSLPPDHPSSISSHTALGGSKTRKKTVPGGEGGKAETSMSRHIGSAAAALAQSHKPRLKARQPGSSVPPGGAHHASSSAGGGGRVKSSTFLSRPVDRVAWRKVPVTLPLMPGEEPDKAYKVGKKWEGLGEGEGPEEGREMQGLEQVWEDSWAEGAGQPIPQRLPLLCKLTKRCPTCSHTLIRPDPKPTSVRYKIKILAGQYLPGVEVGNRRCLTGSGMGSTLGAAGLGMTGGAGAEGGTLGRMGLQDEAQDLGLRLKAGASYTFQLAFTNPLLDTITLTLSSPPTQTGFTLSISDPTFPIGPFTEPWELEVDEELAGDSGTGRSVLKARSRLSVLPRPGRIPPLEQKRNVTKVGMLLSVADGARGRILFDLPLAMTYRAEEEIDPVSGKASTISGSEAGGKGLKIKEVMKTFEFKVRVDLGKIDV